MVTIEPNLLNDYASHTYSIRLYQAPYDEYTKVLRASGLRGLMRSIASSFSRIAILSETAVTPAQINNLTIKSYKSTQGIHASTLTFDIVEPRGATVIEQLIHARTTMGWPDVTDGRGAILEVRFIGRKDNNEVNDNVATISYPIMIGDFEVSLDQSSTTYHVNAALEGQGTATTHHIRQRIPTTMTVDAGNTVADFFNNYAAMLNEKEESLVDNQTRSLPRYIHSFEIDEYYQPLEVGNPKSGTQTSTNQTLDIYNADTNRITFPNNSLIASTIDTVIYSIDKARDDLLEPDDNVVYIHEIFPIVVLGKYDEVAEQYQHEVTWKVHRVPALAGFTDKDTLATLRKKIPRLTDTLKLYDFYYTGTNSEVKSINWKTNHLYTAKITAYRTILTRNNNNRSITGLHSHETVDQDVMQNVTESRPDDTWAVKAEVNDRGETVYYTSDVDVSNVNFLQPKPREIANTADSDHSTTDIDSNQRLIEYLNQLSYIRNMGGERMEAYTSMEMKISGDPYWLLSPNPVMRGGEIVNASSSYIPMFILRFYHPSNAYYESGEFLPNKDLSAFTGLYYVEGTIISTFNNGRFEQTIIASRSEATPSDVAQLIIEGGILY